MCSNYRPTRVDDLAYFGVAPPQWLFDDRDAYPGSPVPMIYQPPEGGGWSCVGGTFGLLPLWAKERKFAKRTYNARIETVAEKPSFRGAWHKRQVCIVPATAFYEPSHETGRPCGGALPGPIVRLWRSPGSGSESTENTACRVGRSPYSPSTPRRIR